MIDNFSTHRESSDRRPKFDIDVLNLRGFRDFNRSSIRPLSRTRKESLAERRPASECRKGGNMRPHGNQVSSRRDARDTIKSGRISSEISGEEGSEKRITAEEC